MRKFFITLSAVLASLAAVSCMEENVIDPEGQEGEYVELSAGFDEDNTKTALGENFSVVWQQNDQIDVSNGTAPFTIKDFKANSTSANFAGKVNPATKSFAVYPSQETPVWDNASVYVTLPSKQEAVAGSFDPHAALAVGEVIDNKVSFKNVGALLGITVNNTNIQSIKVTSNSNVPMSGEGIVAISGNPTVSSTTVDHVMLTGNIESGKTYYMVVYPGNHENGFTLEYTDVNGRTATYDSKGNALDITRSSNFIFANITIPDDKWKTNFKNGNYIVVYQNDNGAVAMSCKNHNGNTKQKDKVALNPIPGDFIAYSPELEDCIWNVKGNSLTGYTFTHKTEGSWISGDKSLTLSKDTADTFTITLQKDGTYLIQNGIEYVGYNASSKFFYCAHFSSFGKNLRLIPVGEETVPRITLGETQVEVADINISSKVELTTIEKNKLVTGKIKLTPTSDGDWLKNPVIENGKIYATIEDNKGEQRKGTITIHYDGITPDIVLTVIQKKYVDPSAGIPKNTVLWSEDFTDCKGSSFKPTKNTIIYGTAEITYTCGGGSTIYNDNLAGGIKPELLVKKNGGTFTVTGIYVTNTKKLNLSYAVNKPGLKVSYKFDNSNASSSTNNPLAISVPQGATTLTIEFSNNSTKDNIRLDDISLTVSE